MRNPLRVVPFLAPLLLPSPLRAQATCGGLTITFSANPVPYGQPVTVTGTNNSGSPVAIAGSCLFQTISQGAVPIYTVPCLPVLTNIPPGGQISQAWDARWNCGQQAESGLYSVNVAILGSPPCPVPLTIAPCSAGGVSSFGVGCNRCSTPVCPGPPVLSVEGCPQIGTTIVFRLTNGAIFVPAAFALGVSNTSWAGTPLPFNVGNGCSVLIAPEVFFFAPGNATGFTSFPVPIPPDPAFVGQTVYAQAGTGRLTTVPALTNGLALTIG